MGAPAPELSAPLTSPHANAAHLHGPCRPHVHVETARTIAGRLLRDLLLGNQGDLLGEGSKKLPVDLPSRVLHEPHVNTHHRGNQDTGLKRSLPCPVRQINSLSDRLRPPETIEMPIDHHDGVGVTDDFVDYSLIDDLSRTTFLTDRSDAPKCPQNLECWSVHERTRNGDEERTFVKALRNVLHRSSERKR